MSCLQIYDIVSKEEFHLPDDPDTWWMVGGFECDEGYLWYNLYEYSGLDGIQMDKPFFVESTLEMPLFTVSFLGEKHIATTRELLLHAMNERGFEKI
jgi:hypothetical protein